MSTQPVNQSSPKPTYHQQPPPMHQCQCSRSSFGLHLFILFALIGSAGFFWLSTGGIEVIRKKNLQPTTEDILTSHSLNKYKMHKNSKNIISNQVTQVETIESETGNEENNIEAATKGFQEFNVPNYLQDQYSTIGAFYKENGNTQGVATN